MVNLFISRKIETRIHNTLEDGSMKAHIDKVSLVQVLQKIQSTTEKKTHMPILSNVLMNAIQDQQMMEFTATDLELSIWTQLKASIEEPGSVTVSARKLLEIVIELTQEEF